MNSARKHYIDNLRWLWIVLLIPYHTAMAYNTWGEDNYVLLSENKVLSSFVTFVSPWFMPLLFVLAGMSARYALNRRTNKQFVEERIHKLLIPLLTGIITIIPIMAYYADRFHNQYGDSFFTHYKVFFTRFTDFTSYDGGFSTGHLWFLLYLFLVSLLSLAIIMVQKKYLPNRTLNDCPYFLLCILSVISLIANYLFSIEQDSLLRYLILFLFGYYVFSNESVNNKLKTYKYISLAVMLVCDGLVTYFFIWQEESGVILGIGSELSSWFGILAFIGLSQVFLNQCNKFTERMKQSSFLIYIFHFPFIIAIQFYLRNASLPIALAVIITILTATIGTAVLCYIIPKIPFIRLLFGCKVRKEVRK